MRPKISSVETDPDRAAAALESFWPGIVLGASDGPVLFRMDGWANDHGLSYIEVELGGRTVTADVEGTSGLMVTTLDAFDGMLTESDARVDDTQPYVTRAGLRSRYRSARTRTLAVDEAVVTTRIRERDLGPLRGDFRFTGTAPKSPQHAVAWRSMSDLIATAMRTGLADDPLLGPALTNTVAEYCIECFPSTWTQPEPGGAISPATVRRAMAFVDEHASEPITVADIAEAARLSVRGLQNAFQTQLGLSPTAYLRRVRLSHARASLLASDPTDEGRVAAIAHAAGFVHLSRFAAAYRAEYGENPRDTLRR